MKIYLDVCCLNRPFDDQSQERTRLESEAVVAILGRSKTLTILSSEIVDLEISKIPDRDRRQKVMLLSSISKINVAIDDEIVGRAKELAKMSSQKWVLNRSMHKRPHPTGSL